MHAALVLAFTSQSDGAERASPPQQLLTIELEASGEGSAAHSPGPGAAPREPEPARVARRASRRPSPPRETPAPVAAAPVPALATVTDDAVTADLAESVPASPALALVRPGALGAKSALGGQGKLGAQGHSAAGGGSAGWPSPRAGAAGAGGELRRARLLTGADVCRGVFPAQAAEDRGAVTLALDVGDSGRPLAMRVVAEKPRGQGFASAARACVPRLRFEPALGRDGKRVASTSLVRLRFARAF